jgi:hypothetical protein
MADRGIGMARGTAALNVRRLMYQPLIWLAALRHEASGLGAALDAKDLEGLADSLVDRVRGDPELGRDLFRRQMLVDEAQTVELAGSQPGNTRRQIIPRRALRLSCGVRHALTLLQDNDAVPPKR